MWLSSQAAPFAHNVTEILHICNENKKLVNSSAASTQYVSYMMGLLSQPGNVAIYNMVSKGKGVLHCWAIRESEKSTLLPPSSHSQPLFLKPQLKSRWKLSDSENAREERRRLRLIPFQKACTSPRARIFNFFQLLEQVKGIKSVLKFKQSLLSSPQHQSERLKPQYSHSERKHGGSGRLLLASYLIFIQFFHLLKKWENKIL